jgi:hypothetical protein
MTRNAQAAGLALALAALLASTQAWSQGMVVGNPPPPPAPAAEEAARAPAAAPVYRQGLPAVMQPKSAVASDDQTAGRFRAAYAARKNPRMIVFWNRALSDSTVANYRSDLRITAHTDQNATGSADIYASRRQATVSGGSAGSATTTIDASAGRTAVDSMPRPGFAELQDWSAESAFSRTMVEAGAHLIDRAVAIRTTAAKDKPGKDDVPDRQYAEGAALLAKADILVEVLQAPDRERRTGFSFRVNIKEIQSGRILGSFISDADAAAGEVADWVPGRDGFQQKRDAVTEAIGRRLATDTMRALLTGWGA